MIENITKYYSDISKNIYFEHVHHEELLGFADKLQHYQQELKDDNYNDNCLIEALNLFKKILFKLCGTFIPFNKAIDEQTKNDLLSNLIQIKNGYPHFFEKIVNPAGKVMNLLLQTDKNIFREQVCSFINKTYGPKDLIAIVTKRLLTAEEKQLILNNVNFFTNIYFYPENRYRKTEMFFKSTIFIGTVNYFSSFATNTFKSENTVFMAYDIFSLKKPIYHTFSYIPDTELVNTIYKNINFSANQEKVKPIEIENEVSIKAVVDKFLEMQPDHAESRNMHPIEASIVFLENGRFIFVSRESKIRVFSISEKNNLVKQIQFKDLEEEDFIIIRNERDTKLIAEVADNEILKDKAESFRMLQELWKEKLRYNVKKKGIRKVADILTNRYGLTTASTVSVRSWCNDESICPTELPILLTALKFDSSMADKITKSMKIIQKAHRKAGRIISTKLMKELNPSIYKELLEKGYYTFESKEFDGASFNIERVLTITSEKYIIMPYNLMKPISIDD